MNGSPSATHLGPISTTFALARSLELDEGPAIRNPAVREKLADWYVKTVGLKYAKFRTMTALSRGQTPWPEASITKLVSASKLQEICLLWHRSHGHDRRRDGWRDRADGSLVSGGAPLRAGLANPMRSCATSLPNGFSDCPATFVPTRTYLSAS